MTEVEPGDVVFGDVAEAGGRRQARARGVGVRRPGLQHRATVLARHALDQLVRGRADAATPDVSDAVR